MDKRVFDPSELLRDHNAYQSLSQTEKSSISEISDYRFQLVNKEEQQRFNASTNTDPILAEPPTLLIRIKQENETLK